LAVRTEVPWWGRGLVVATLVALIGAMWWWGFDFGRIFGRVTGREAEERVTALVVDNAALRTEAAELRGRLSRLESELAMARGAQEATARQAADLASENAELKEETAFLRQLFADANQQPGMSMPRLSVERQNEELWRYSLLIVRGGNPRDDFAGRVVLQATLQAPSANTETMLTLPDDQPDTAPMLRLAFRYYQRVEGTFRVPPGARVTALEARAFESGSGSPRASRSVTSGLTNP
jgi:pimeloyl-ACP methyl ester carboxylesterase